MVEEPNHRTMTLRWETEVCPRCKERTTFWLVTDRISRCSQCNLEKDRGAGLCIDPAVLDRE